MILDSGAVLACRMPKDDDKKRTSLFQGEAYS